MTSFVGLFAGVLAFVFLSTSSSAQTSNGFGQIKSVSVPTLENQLIDEAIAKRKVLFERMLARPDDLDTAFAYATLSIQLGDIEAAISTLERMLVLHLVCPASSWNWGCCITE